MSSRLPDFRRDMKEYPLGALLLILALALVAAFLLASAISQASANYMHFGVLALLAVVVGLASSRHSLELKATHMWFSGADCLAFLVVFMFGPLEAALLAAVDGFAISRRIRSRPSIYVFNIANFVTSVYVAGRVFYFARATVLLHGNPSGLGRPVLAFAIPLFALALAYYALNHISTAAMAKLIFRTPFRDTIGKKLPWEPMVYLAEAIAAGAVHYVAVNCDLITATVALVLAVPVPILIYYTFKAYKDRLEERDRHYKELTDINDSILEMLAMAVDAKDQTTHDHLQRVKLFARHLGEILGISEADMNALKAGALLHDIGKIGVPAYILNKPGKLTQHEFEQMKMHTIIGADMLSNIKFGYPVAPVVRHHHERWDGQGYPDGLMGEQIPITARILTLVDCYDALRSDRPYHKAMTREKALKYLADNKEIFFDPNLVDIFISEVDDLEA